jgi:hypothetical protein
MMLNSIHETEESARLSAHGKACFIQSWGVTNVTRDDVDYIDEAELDKALGRAS